MEGITMRESNEKGFILRYTFEPINGLNAETSTSSVYSYKAHTIYTRESFENSQ